MQLMAGLSGSHQRNRISRTGIVRYQFQGLASDGGAGPLGRGLEPPCIRGTSSPGKPQLCSRGFWLNEPGLHRQSRTVSLLKVT